ncbi:MAG: hypothetical protein ACRDXB_00335, partial [Actinomycetes bacterium]
HVARPGQIRGHVQVLTELRILIVKTLLVIQQRDQFIPTFRRQGKLNHTSVLTAGPRPSPPRIHMQASHVMGSTDVGKFCVSGSLEGYGHGVGKVVGLTGLVEGQAWPSLIM